MTRVSTNLSYSYLYFNSHAHVERDETSSFYDGEDKNFNSHAHVERDQIVGSMVPQCKISTHTLTWSVTFLTAKNGIRKKISTHTLTWSVTFSQCFASASFSYFNSHAHVERDVNMSKKDIFNAISTHTLTWSVTQNDS